MLFLIVICCFLIRNITVLVVMTIWVMMEQTIMLFILIIYASIVVYMSIFRFYLIFCMIFSCMIYLFIWEKTITKIEIRNIGFEYLYKKFSSEVQGIILTYHYCSHYAPHILEHNSLYIDYVVFLTEYKVKATLYVGIVFLFLLAHT